MKRVYSRIFKRIFDFCFSLVGLLIALPIILLCSIFIRMESPGSPIFTQERIGYKCKRFKIYKLRTMTTRTHDADGNKIRDRHRVTKLGKFIRKLSLDELPQLFNILKGDMSFIGPRPLLIRYFPYYTEEEVHRHDERPGITGLAQVNGRSDLQWEQRFALDLEYIRNISLPLDLKIFFQTVMKVLKRENTSTIRPANLVDFDVHRQNDKNFVMRKDI